MPHTGVKKISGPKKAITSRTDTSVSVPIGPKGGDKDMSQLSDPSFELTAPECSKQKGLKPLSVVPASKKLGSDGSYTQPLQDVITTKKLMN